MSTTTNMQCQNNLPYKLHRTPNNNVIWLCACVGYWPYPGVGTRASVQLFGIVTRMYPYVLVCYSYVLVWCFSHDLSVYTTCHQMLQGKSFIFHVGCDKQRLSNHPDLLENPESIKQYAIGIGKIPIFISLLIF